MPRHIFGDFGNALAQSELGLNYDDSVADLWYVKAAAKSGLGESKADVLPLVMKSITEGEWVDYNRDGARVLYADLLCDTGNYVQAIAILDSKPFVYSADAEFIRVKSYYCMRTGNQLLKQGIRLILQEKFTLLMSGFLIFFLSMNMICID